MLHQKVIGDCIGDEKTHHHHHHHPDQINDQQQHHFYINSNLTNGSNGDLKISSSSSSNGIYLAEKSKSLLNSQFKKIKSISNPSTIINEMAITTDKNIKIETNNNTKINNFNMHHHPNMKIGEFFAHKNIFITGGTGFLGTVLVETLLSSSPDIGYIFVLVRGKHGFDANERINRMLQKPIFAKHNYKTLQKVIPVVGELSEPNLGFKDELYNELIEKVNIIFHSAATIRFSSPLRVSIKINLTGTLRTIEFAKNLKNLSAYVYLSTAFCNSNNRGEILEIVYKSRYDPYEMIKMAEDDKVWESFTQDKLKEMLQDHPNTYTFTKNLAENLIVAEMSGLPAAIVRPSIVYGTWEKPIPGWVGNANSGHLGFLAGYIKGVFRTFSGHPTSPVDIIPCDYVINSTLVMGWYVGTRHLEKPEVIHCTSGEVNPLTLAGFTEILNKGAKLHPCDYYVFMPYAKLRTGWRYTLFFYIFQIFPAMLILIPETLFNIGMTHHTTLEYMRVFNKGTKAFDYFLDKDFRYSLKNALRIIDTMNDEDKKCYNFDSSKIGWLEFMCRCLIGVRRFYFKESLKTTEWHRYYWKVYEVIYYSFFFILLLVIFGFMSLLFGMKIGFALALGIWGFLVWL